MMFLRQTGETDHPLAGAATLAQCSRRYREPVHRQRANQIFRDGRHGDADGRTSDFAKIIPLANGAALMATAIDAAATGEQVREPDRELTEDELIFISGGKPSSNSTMQSDVNPQ